MIVNALMKKMPWCSFGAILSGFCILIDYQYRTVAAGYLIFFVNLLLMTIIYSYLFDLNKGRKVTGYRKSLSLMSVFKFVSIFLSLGICLFILKLPAIQLFSGCLVSLMVYLAENIVNYNSLLKSHSSA